MGRHSPQPAFSIFERILELPATLEKMMLFKAEYNGFSSVSIIHTIWADIQSHLKVIWTISLLALLLEMEKQLCVLKNLDHPSQLTVGPNNSKVRLVTYY